MGKDRQINSWGYIDWIQRELSGGGFPASIGFVNLLPGKRQAEHTHHSEAQFLYTLTGYGEHIINGKHYQFGPGDHFLMDSGVVHATINRGEEIMQELIVSIPIHLCRDADSPPARDESTFDPDFARAALLDGIAQLTRDTLDHVNMPVVLADSSQRIVYCKGLPPLCGRCGEPACPLGRSVHELHSEHRSACSSVICPRGLTVLVQPVMLDNRACGFIKGGLFRQYPNIPAAGEVYDVPDSTVNAARFFLQDISSYLAAFYQERRRQRPARLPAGEAAGVAEQLRTNTLNIQIRNHLLFNTLNSIASLAIRDGSMDTYRAIIDLAELLRGLLRREGERVPLSEEIAFLQRYINLQTLRFEDSLQVTWQRCGAAERIFVPHNFLQPIVENALLHGYNDGCGQRRELLIETALEDGRSVVRIRDNGCGMDEQTLERLRSALYSGAAHGLSMVNRKLAGVFGQDFRFDITSRPGEGTCCLLSFPV